MFINPLFFIFKYEINEIKTKIMNLKVTFKKNSLYFMII